MNSKEKLQTAMTYAMENRPKVGGFPFLAECLRRAGVEKNVWALPAAQSIYVMKEAVIVQPGVSLVSLITEAPDFDEKALIAALRTDQSGQSTFPEFLLAAWRAGVISYEVNFSERTVTYYGARGEKYMESYAEVEVGDMGV